jgi:hypothetical protein
LEHLLKQALSLYQLGRSLGLELLNTLVSFHPSVHLLFDVWIVQLRFLNHVWGMLLLVALFLFILFLFRVFRFFNRLLLFFKLFLCHLHLFENDLVLLKLGDVELRVINVHLNSFLNF